LGADFPHFLYKASADGADTSVLLLLHGLGDAPQPFLALGEKMALPQCALLAVQAPIPLLDLGWQWYPGFDSQGAPLATGSPLQQTGLVKVRAMLHRLVQALSATHGWDRRDVYMLGFSQGGTVALDFAFAEASNDGGSISGNDRGALGGVVSVSGPLFEWHCTAGSAGAGNDDGAKRASAPAVALPTPTPALLTLGQQDQRVPHMHAILEFERLRETHPTTTSLFTTASFPRTLLGV
jgi:poly(3-hydroxybutyrate) depolymerase